MVLGRRGEPVSLGAGAACLGNPLNTMLWLARTMVALGIPLRAVIRFGPARSIQYLSIRYTERLVDAGVQLSAGSVGDSYDNALAETVNGLYKAEVVHRRSWRTLQEVELANLQWVHRSTTIGCSDRSDTCRRQKQRKSTIGSGALRWRGVAPNSAVSENPARLIRCVST